jgi:hypothetical protein
MRYSFYLSVSAILIITAFLGGCAVKKMSKQAAQFEAAGMFKEAADLYYQAAMKKPQEVDYRIGLKRSGQIYLDELSAGIAQSYNRGDHKKTVYDYLVMQDFAAKVKRAGIDLNIDYTTQRYYENAKDAYLDKRYESGQRLLIEQNYDEARKVFTEVHRINPDFKDTRSYLNTSTYEPFYQNGTRLFSQGKYMEAYREWDRIATHESNYKDVKVRMQQALAERYKEGTLLLMDEDFNAAALALGDVYNVDRNYQDVSSLYLEARNEPVYRSAKQSLTEGRCRTAYFNFEDILQDAGTYKDVGELQKEALACAQYPIAVYAGAMPNFSKDGNDFESALLEHILRQNNPFVKVYRLDAVNSRIKRTFRNPSGTIDQSQLEALHAQHGIKAVLTLNFSEYRKVDGKLIKKEKTGFERQPVKTTTGETTYHDKKVTYYEYEKTNDLALTMNYQLISTVSGEILLSQRLNGSDDDYLNYAVYDGDQKRLFPASVRNNTYSLDEKNYSGLQQLLRTDARIIPVEKLRDRVFADLTGQIAHSVNTFNPEQ